MAQQPEQELSSKEPGVSAASVVLGIISLLAWLFPLVGFPISIVGLVLGIRGRRRRPGSFSTAGLICGSIGLGLTLVNSALGVYLALHKG